MYSHLFSDECWIYITEFKDPTTALLERYHCYFDTVNWKNIIKNKKITYNFIEKYFIFFNKLCWKLIAKKKWGNSRYALFKNEKEWNNYKKTLVKYKSDKCFICLEDSADCVLIPCGHMHMCLTCTVVYIELSVLHVEHQLMIEQT